MLQEIYYAQKDYQKTHKRWARTLTELDLEGKPHPGVARTPSLQPTSDGFVVTTAIDLGDGQLELWHIREDAKVWRE